MADFDWDALFAGPAREFTQAEIDRAYVDFLPRTDLWARVFLRAVRMQLWDTSKTLYYTDKKHRSEGKRL
jgi:hypothetical protein